MSEYHRLDEICFLNMGQSPDSKRYNENGDGLPFFQGNADFGEMYPSVRIWCDTPTKIVEAGTLLISVRAPIGELNFAEEKSCIGRGLAGITPRDNTIIKYIYYCLVSKHYELNAKGTGSTFKAITKTALAEIKVRMIPLLEQLKVVKMLDMANKVITTRKQQLSALDTLIKARFVEMFGNPVLNDKCWKQNPLGDITTKIGSGATPKRGKEAYQKEGISLIRSMNIHNGIFEYKELAHISDEQAAKLDNVTVKEDDVLLNITGASVARSCVVPSGILPARVNQHVCIIRCKECIIPEFLNKLLIDDNYQNLLWSIAGSGATREAITKQQVESLQIILPSIEFQKEFMQFVTQVDKSKVVVNNTLKKMLEIIAKETEKNFIGHRIHMEIKHKGDNMSEFNFLNGNTKYNSIESLCHTAENADKPIKIAEKCRETLNEIIAYIYKRYEIQKPADATMIEQLDGKIIFNFVNDKVLLDSLHYIRKLGMNAQHGLPVTKAQAKLSLDNLVFFTRYMVYKFDAPEKLKDYLLPPYMSEAKTRKIYIDLYLNEAGWDVFPPNNIKKTAQWYGNPMWNGLSIKSLL